MEVVNAKEKFPELVKDFKKSREKKSSKKKTAPDGPPSGLGAPPMFKGPKGPPPPSSDRSAAMPPAPPPPPEPAQKKIDLDENPRDNDNDNNSDIDNDPTDEPLSQLYEVVIESGATIRKHADMFSPLMGLASRGETLTIHSTNKVWCDNDNVICEQKNEGDTDGFWRMQVMAPRKFRGWISQKDHIAIPIDSSSNPHPLHHQANRRKAEYLKEITSTMIDVSLVAARHASQLRSQRKKVFAGVKNVLQSDDPRVLGVLDQMGADEAYEIKVRVARAFSSLRAKR